MNEVEQEILLVKKEYNQIKTNIKQKYLLIYNTLKTKNAVLVSSLKDLYNQLFICLNLEEERQILIEEHCNHSSIYLIRHEEYHEKSNILVNSILTYFSRYKTFLNELTIYFSRNVLKDKRNIKIKSFGSLLSSIKNYEDSDLFILLLKKYKERFENILYFRDKYIEHSKESYEFNLITIPYKGCTLRPTIKKDEESDNLLEKLIQEDRVDKEKIKLELITVGDPQFPNCFIFYYHVHNYRYPYFEDAKLAIPKLDALPGEVLFEVSDNTEIHFKKYGVHHHVFPDQELIHLANRINSNKTNQIIDDKNISINYVSPNYIESYILLISFILEIFYKKIDITHAST